LKNGGRLTGTVEDDDERLVLEQTAGSRCA
jgi:hypothetical protein